MKNSFIVIVLIAFIAVIGKPVISKVVYNDGHEIQREEASPNEITADDGTYVITHHMKETDEEVGDIVWMQKAAEFAIDKGLPYFNVLDFDMGTSSVEGRIQLMNDPMGADYDANEILSLNLTDDAAE